MKGERGIVIYRLSNKQKTGVVYAYLQTAFRDPVSKKPKSKRTYLGRVDPITGKIVPKETDGKRNRSKLGEEVFEFAQPSEESAQSDNEIITSQRRLIEKLTLENERLRRIISNIRDLTNG